ncbi:hypothetical protein ACFQ07_27110, partial [Actinomadura adrarensis]
EVAGFALPASPRAPYIFDAGETFGGAITVEDGLSDEALGLIWDVRAGWLAGPKVAGSWVQNPTDLGIGVAPPPQVVVAAVRQISQEGRVRVSYPRVKGVYPATLLVPYAQNGAVTTP